MGKNSPSKTPSDKKTTRNYRGKINFAKLEKERQEFVNGLPYMNTRNDYHTSIGDYSEELSHQYGSEKPQTAEEIREILERKY